MASEEMAYLEYGGKRTELPVVKGSEGQVGIDISKLQVKAGCITYDNGFANTGSCLSDITYVDGEEGVLRYRGYDIEDLVLN